MKKKLQKLEEALERLKQMIDAREKELATLYELRDTIKAFTDD